MKLFKKKFFVFFFSLGLISFLIFLIEPNYIRSIGNNFITFVIKKNISEIKYPNKLIKKFNYQEKQYNQGETYSFQDQTLFYMKIPKTKLEPADIIFKIFSGTLILDHVIEFDSNKKFNIFDSIGKYIPFHGIFKSKSLGSSYPDIFSLSLDYSFSGNANPYSTLILNPSKYPDVYFFFTAYSGTKISYFTNLKYR